MSDPVYLRPADFYYNLSQNDKLDLQRIGVRRSYKREQLVFQTGKTSDEVYVLLEGRVKIYELSCEGREVILWFCFPGELFGLSEVMRIGVREVNAQACGNCEVLTVQKDDFERFIMSRPAAARGVIDVLSCRLRELSNVLLNLASDDVSSRVIKLITRLGARYGAIMDDNVYLDIPITHQEMADMIGTSRQTVTTVLGDLRRKGILRIEQRNICIQDPEWVEAITVGCSQREVVNSVLLPPSQSASSGLHLVR